MQPHIFPSFEDYGAAIQHATVHVTVTGKPRADWGVMHLSLRDLFVQWGQAGGANIAEGQVQSGGISILIPLDNAPAIVGNGHRYDDDTLMLLGAGAEFCIAAADYNQWASVFVPIEALGRVAGEPVPVAPFRCHPIRPEAQDVRRLRDLVQRIIAAARETPEAFTTSASRDAAELELENALRPVLQPASPVASAPAATGRHTIPREQIIRTVTDLLTHRLDEAISIERLASAADISERTLRTVFNDYFGVSPVRYVKLKTLHQARRALREADPATATVTAIASRLGVWEFGRFAHDYHDLFGEVPSQTLRNLRQKRHSVPV